ncbi:sugar phosphate isomerase/epimerase [Friedmanniella endophytica]|uniref:Sugar phosphate isomerase/epimerase n=1 Tax=Microlunatus kandeliicorticis TaxID=1759536 RepID=A0A7W3IVB1_9ACTN|nr:TIM barrel protein [Microlunatus kandeliicorticis]MBA8795917.1 sugar phosphate isomerase/epimerase [Microlunatus kandeliicorticis]
MVDATEVTHALHAWSLHRTLGGFIAPHANPDGSEQLTPTPAAAGALELLDLPAELVARGYDTVQICHFHLPSRDPGYLAELRSALATAGVRLDALLVDAGDLVHPTDADAHEAWIAGWLEDAETLGATRARVIAGQADPTPERLDASARRLARLAASTSVRLVTENWMALLPSAAEVVRLLETAGDGVGLLVDLANWTVPDRDAQLARIGGLAETSHAKCRTTPDGALDTENYRGALRAVLDAGFTGPLCLVYDGPDPDEWGQLAGCQRVVEQELAVAVRPGA